MKFAVVYEKAETNYSVYVPDLPGCVSVGDTLEEAMRMIREAIEFHLEGMMRDGEPIPQPSTEVGYVEIDAHQVRANLTTDRKLSARKREGRKRA